MSIIVNPLDAINTINTSRAPIGIYGLKLNTRRDALVLDKNQNITDEALAFIFKKVTANPDLLNDISNGQIYLFILALRERKTSSPTFLKVQFLFAKYFLEQNPHLNERKITDEELISYFNDQKGLNFNEFLIGRSNQSNRLKKLYLEKLIYHFDSKVCLLDKYYDVLKSLDDYSLKFLPDNLDKLTPILAGFQKAPALQEKLIFHSGLSSNMKSPEGRILTYGHTYCFMWDNDTLITHASSMEDLHYRVDSHINRAKGEFVAHALTAVRPAVFAARAISSASLIYEIKTPNDLWLLKTQAFDKIEPRNYLRVTHCASKKINGKTPVAKRIQLLLSAHKKLTH
jgi:hypothetical protein